MIKLLKKLAKKVVKAPENSFPHYFYHSRISSGLYYLLLSKSMYREFQSVLAGKSKHLKDSKKNRPNYFLLVRNTHRLEKALLMKPRKKIFASGYIEETVNSYIGVMNDNHNNKYASSQIQWVTDVLNEYFSVVGSDEIIDRQRDLFNKCSTFSLFDSTVKKLPYKRSFAETDCVSFDDFYKLSKQRRSVRWFEDKAVPRELIDKALLAAIQAPSACNRQPFEFRIFDDPEMVKKVAHLPMGTTGYAHNIKTIIVVIGNLDAYFSERDRHIIYIDASLASMSFMYALETLGLSSCPINWPDIEYKEKEMSDLLSLELYQRPIMLIAVGYPDKKEKVAFSEKRSLEYIRNYN